MKRYPIIREVSNLIIAPIILFALYVQFHGDFGPGGGFQAGVIFATAFMLYAIVYGLKSLQRVLSQGFIKYLMAFGLLIYLGVGFASLLLGGNFLDYDYLAKDHHVAQELGIFLVELGVGITVAGVMLTIFYAFVERKTYSDKL